jgi:hypothetical protein
MPHQDILFPERKTLDELQQHMEILRLMTNNALLNDLDMMEGGGFTQVLLHRPDSSKLEQEQDDQEVDALNETIGATGGDGRPGGEGTVKGGEGGPSGEGGEGVIEGGAGGDGGQGGNGDEQVEMVVQEVMEVLANGEVEEEEAVNEVLVGEEAVVTEVAVVDEVRAAQD